MSDPKVSVIVPVYNGENFLAGCLDSLVNQSLTDIEIIVVDDGSVDATGEICASYRALDKRIVHLRQTNGGVSAARNAGMRVARGRYLAFSDADDVMMERGIERLFETAETCASDLVVGAYLVGRLDKYRVVRPAKAASSSDLLASILNGTNHGALWNKMIRRSAIGDLRFREDIRYAEDQLFLTEFLLSGDWSLAFQYSPVYVYTVMRADSATGSKGATLFHLFASRIHIGGLLVSADVSPHVIDAFERSAANCVLSVVRGIDRRLLAQTKKELASYSEQLGKMGLQPRNSATAMWLCGASKLPMPMAVAVLSVVRVLAAAMSRIKRGFLNE